MSNSLFEPDEIPAKRAIDPRADAFMRPVSEAPPVKPAEYPCDEATSEAQARAYAFSAGLCDVCREREMVHYLKCEDRQGNHLPNRWVCGECLPQAEQEARAAGRFTKFPADLGLSKWKRQAAMNNPNLIIRTEPDGTNTLIALLRSETGAFLEARRKHIANPIDVSDMLAITGDWQSWELITSEEFDAYKFHLGSVLQPFPKGQP